MEGELEHENSLFLPSEISTNQTTCQMNNRETLEPVGKSKSEILIQPERETDHFAFLTAFICLQEEMSTPKSDLDSGIFSGGKEDTSS